MQQTLASESQALGIFDMTAEEYFAVPALSNSGMKDLAVSPLRYWHRWINPEREEREETPALRIGSALHCAVLESDEAFESRYACALDPADWPVCLDTIGDLREWITSKGEKPKGTRKDDVVAQALSIMSLTGEHVPILQEENRRFLAENAGKTILTPDEWRRVTGMHRALSGEPALKPILAEGQAEVSIFARDPETSVMLKARLDWMAPKHTADFKTFQVRRSNRTVDETIADAIYFERYWVQAYFYDHVRRLATGQRSQFVMPFVESEPPHETRIKRLQPTSGSTANNYWSMAENEVKRLIREYAGCMKNYGDKPWRWAQEIEPLEDAEMKAFVY